MKKILPNITLKDAILYGAGIGFATFMLIFLISVTIIGYSVKQQCQIAQAKYAGDCVAALCSYLDDTTNSFRSRNSAVWALGQLGDERSRTVLEKWYTGYGGERISLSNGLSQYELRRAIRYLDGYPNITTFFWRFGKGIE
ncbi:MAG: hypothetical protein WC505_04340 [Patescibacteria group bacterium]